MKKDGKYHQDMIPNIDKEIEECLTMSKDNLRKVRAKEVSEEQGLIEYMNIMSRRCTLEIVKRDLINILNE